MEGSLKSDLPTHINLSWKNAMAVCVRTKMIAGGAYLAVRSPPLTERDYRGNPENAILGQTSIGTR